MNDFLIYSDFGNNHKNKVLAYSALSERLQLRGGFVETLVFESFDELESLETSWNQLLSKSPDKNPFLTYEWLSTWWKHFGKGRRLEIFIARENGEIILIAPTMYTQCRAFGARLRKLELVASPASDYSGFIVGNFERASKAVKQFIEKIMERLSVLDCIELREVPEDSDTAELLRNLETDSCKVTSRVVNRCPYLSFPDRFESFLQNLGPNMRRNLKRWERHAINDFKIDFVEYEKIGTTKDAMKLFFDLHQKRWRSKGKPGSFAKRANRDFHLTLAEIFSRQGRLALFFLTFNDEPVSAVYCYKYNGKLFAYLTGFDPEYAEYRPGHLAFKRLIKYGVDERLKELDFLRGMEGYKALWNTNIRKNVELIISKGTFKNKIHDFIANGRLSFLFR